MAVVLPTQAASQLKMVLSLTIILLSRATQAQTRYGGLFNSSKYSHDENVGNRVFGVNGVWRFEGITTWGSVVAEVCFKNGIK